jgi:hypothetical protein
MNEQSTYAGLDSVSKIGLARQFVVVSFFVLLLVVGSPAFAGKHAADFKTYDMTGFEFTPLEHRDKGLEKVPVLYMCSMFRADFVSGVNNCNDVDLSEPAIDVIRQRAAESIGKPIVTIDIEGGTWNFHSFDLDVVQGAVDNWQILIDTWLRVNPDTKILIYGGMPKVYWAIATHNLELMGRYEAQALKIAPLFKNDRVGLWPNAYLQRDMPDIYREERRWQIDVCHKVYRTKCYFAINPQYGSEWDATDGFELHMDQNSFLEIMSTLKEDGADGFGLWIHPGHLSYDYESRMERWSAKGGSGSRIFDRDLMWLKALTKFLDANNLSRLRDRRN